MFRCVAALCVALYLCSSHETDGITFPVPFGSKKKRKTVASIGGVMSSLGGAQPTTNKQQPQNSNSNQGSPLKHLPTDKDPLVRLDVIKAELHFEKYEYAEGQALLEEVIKQTPSSVRALVHLIHLSLDNDRLSYSWSKLMVLVELLEKAMSERTDDNAQADKLLALVEVYDHIATWTSKQKVYPKEGMEQFG